MCDHPSIVLPSQGVRLVYECRAVLPGLDFGLFEFWVMLSFSSTEDIILEWEFDFSRR